MYTMSQSPQAGQFNSYQAKIFGYFRATYDTSLNPLKRVNSILTETMTSSVQIA